MSRYRKALVALAGLLAQVALALPSILDSGAVPPAWEPWLRLLVALATALGVYATPNAGTAGAAGRHAAGDESTVAWLDGPDRTVHRGDRGSGLVLLVVLVAAGLLVAASAGPALADSAHRRPGVRVNGAGVCEGVLMVHWEEISRTADPTLDDGRAQLFVHAGGRWVEAVGSGGEHTFRIAPSPAGADVVLVTHARSVSRTAAVGGCPE